MMCVSQTLCAEIIRMIPQYHFVNWIFGSQYWQSSGWKQSSLSMPFIMCQTMSNAHCDAKGKYTAWPELDRWVIFATLVRRTLPLLKFTHFATCNLQLATLLNLFSTSRKQKIHLPASKYPHLPQEFQNCYLRPRETSSELELNSTIQKPTIRVSRLCRAQSDRMNSSDLPLELVQHIILEAVLVWSIKRALILRLVSSESAFLYPNFWTEFPLTCIQDFSLKKSNMCPSSGSY